MKPTLIARTINALLDAGNLRALYISGPPGTAKTSIPEQVAAQRGIGCIKSHVPTMPVDDFGVPFPNADKDGLTYLLNDRFPLEGSHWPDHGILIADELGQADGPAQKGWANIIQSREIHGRKLKAGWLIIGTGNRTVDRAGANRLLTHLKDRMTEIEADISIDDWGQWALQNDVHPVVVAFSRFDKDFYSFDPNHDHNATFRGWTEGVSPVIGTIPAEAEYEMFRGTVGEAMATKFCAFLTMYRKLPNPDAVIMDPLGTAVPEEPSVRFALCGALASRVTVDNFPAICSFVRRLPAEFATMAILDCIRKVPEVQSTRAYIDWATTDGKAVIL